MSAGGETTTATEDYLRQIYLAQEHSGQDLVSMGRIAELLSVVPGTATAMVKRLAEGDYLVYEPYSGVRLTQQGQRAALRVVRRHRLVESLLVDVLGLDWSEVHEEADRLEHAVSDKLLDRIDSYLGYPSVDPHGDPIPDADGVLRESKLVPLAECSAGMKVRVARVLDQDENFLRFVEQHALKPGTKLDIEQHDPVAAAVTVRTSRFHAITMGLPAAAKLLVEESDPGHARGGGGGGGHTCIDGTNADRSADPTVDR
ncbi:MAG: metal-dependent transcriptional regulator [Planctomycetota bacterium]